jgi:hypothetical protein
MPRGAAAVLGGGCLAVVLAALLALARDERTLAFSNGVAPIEPALELGPGQRACQLGVAVVEPFAAVSPAADTGGAPGPVLGVSVRRSGARRSGLAPGGYASRLDDPASYPIARVGPVPAGPPVDVCIANGGSRPVALGGTVGNELRDSRLVREGGGAPQTANLHLVFLRERPTSLLTELPRALRRAALFHPPWIGAWTFWLLAGLVTVAVPLLLGRALAWAEQDA